MAKRKRYTSEQIRQRAKAIKTIKKKRKPKKATLGEKIMIVIVVLINISIGSLLCIEHENERCSAFAEYIDIAPERVKALIEDKENFFSFRD